MTQSGIQAATSEFQQKQANEDIRPIQSSAGHGIIKDIEKNQNQWAANLAKQHDQLIEYELEAAKLKDKRYDKLVNLSEKALELAKPALEAGRDKAHMEGAQIWMDDVAENGDLLNAEFDAEENRLTELEAGNNKIVDEAAKRGEVDVFLQERLKKLPWRQRYGYLKARYESHAMNYPLFFEQAKVKMEVPVMTDDGVKMMTLKQATDPNHYNQIMQRIHRAYIRPFAQEDQVMANKYLYKEMRTHDETEFQSFVTNAEATLKAENAELGKSNLLNSIKTGGGAQAISNYGKLYQTDHNGIGGAVIKAFDLTKEQVSLGLVTEDQIRKIENDTYIRNDGVESTFGKDRPGKIAELWDALYARQAKESQQKSAKETAIWEKAEQEIIDALPDEVDDKQIEKAQETLVGLKGGLMKRSSKLDNIKKDLSLDSKLVKTYTDEAERLANNGLLTTKRLSQMPWQVQRKFRDVAALQDTIPTEGKIYIKSIDDMVKAGIKSTADGIRDPSSRLLSYRLQQKYAKRVAQLKASQDPKISGNAAELAYKEIEVEFENKWNKPPYKSEKGYNLGGPTLRQTQTSAKIANDDIRKFNAILDLKGGDAIYYKDTFFNEAELKAMEKGYGKKGWQPHPRAVWLASRLKNTDTGGPMDPLTVINAQRVASDLPELTDLPSLKGYRKLDPKFQEVLCRYGSHDRSCRAWSSTGKFNEEIVPNQLATKVKEVAERNDLNPAILAGMLETAYDWNSITPGMIESFVFSPENYEAEKDILKSAAKYGYTDAWSDPRTFRNTFKPPTTSPSTTKKDDFDIQKVKEKDPLSALSNFPNK